MLACKKGAAAVGRMRGQQREGAGKQGAQKTRCGRGSAVYQCGNLLAGMQVMSANEFFQFVGIAAF